MFNFHFFFLTVVIALSRKSIVFGVVPVCAVAVSLWFMTPKAMAFVWTLCRLFLRLFVSSLRWSNKWLYSALTWPLRYIAQITTALLICRFKACPDKCDLTQPWRGYTHCAQVKLFSSRHLLSQTVNVNLFYKNFLLLSKVIILSCPASSASACHPLSLPPFWAPILTAFYHCSFPYDQFVKSQSDYCCLHTEKLQSDVHRHIYFIITLATAQISCSFSLPAPPLLLLLLLYSHSTKLHLTDSYLPVACLTVATVKDPVCTVGLKRVAVIRCSSWLTSHSRVISTSR